MLLSATPKASRALLSARVYCSVCCDSGEKAGLLRASKDSVAEHMKLSYVSKDGKVKKTQHAIKLQNRDRRRAATASFEENMAMSSSSNSSSASSSSSSSASSSSLSGIVTSSIFKFVKPRAELARTDKATLLAVGHLLAGGSGRDQVPPTAIPAVLSKSGIAIIGLMRNGCPSAKTIRSTTRPALETLIRLQLKSMLKGMIISIVIDGGSSNLSDSRKVIVVCATSPELDEPVCLEVIVLSEHEDSEIQARIIREICMSYEIDPTNVHYLSADNTALNPKTVERLRTDTDEDKTGLVFGNLQFAPCFPHLLSRIINTFLGAFNEKYRFTTFLKKLRSFITAGGGCKRKITLKEHALRLSKIDFADTRWASLVEAIVYMMSPSTDHELATARKYLEEAVARGDETAADALEEPDVKVLHWNAFSQFVKEISEDASWQKILKQKRKEALLSSHLPEESLPATQSYLLATFAQVDMFAAFSLMSSFLVSPSPSSVGVSSLFKLTQASDKFVPETIVSCAGAADTLVSVLSDAIGSNYDVLNGLRA